MTNTCDLSHHITQSTTSWHCRIIGDMVNQNHCQYHCRHCPGKWRMHTFVELGKGSEASKEASKIVKRSWKVYSNRALQTFCAYCDEEIPLDQPHGCFTEDQSNV